METLRSKNEKAEALQEDCARKIQSAIRSGQADVVTQIAAVLSLPQKPHALLDSVSSLSRKQLRKFVEQFDVIRKQSRNNHC